MVSTVASFEQQLDNGGPLIVAPNPNAWPDLARSAQTLGYAFYDIDCGRAKSMSGVLKAIGLALEFPDQTTTPLSALYDCLTDTVMTHDKGMVVLMRGLHCRAEPLLQDPAPLLQAFEDAAEYAQDYGRVLAYAVEAL